MDLLQECATAFDRLLPYEYHFTIGRKGKILTFTLDFDKADFQYLASRTILYLKKKKLIH